MSHSHKLPDPCRIALVWEDHRLQAQRTYDGICRQAGLAAAVTLQCFDAFHLGFQRGIAKPLREWSPHGVIVRVNEVDQIASLRHMLPGVPIVSTLIVPPEIAHTCVGSDITETIALARDHFQAHGVAHIAMFCSANAYAAAPRIAAFRTAVPGGKHIEFSASGKPRGSKKIKEWLNSLPKPAGVMALEIGAAPYLLACCHQFGLRVPEDIQIIGADDDDVSLACQPHLTSIHLPGKRIGERAMDAVLRLLKKTSPPPPAVICVRGSLMITRGSTGPAASSHARITQALRLMQSQLHHGISVEGVADMLGVGLTTFYKEFVESTGETPAHHLRQLRLQEACRILRESDASVTQIAQQCGFRSLISFVQFFRRQTGQTPSEYRAGALCGKSPASTTPTP